MYDLYGQRLVDCADALKILRVSRCHHSGMPVGFWVVHCNDSAQHIANCSSDFTDNPARSPDMALCAPFPEQVGIREHHF